MHLVIQRSLTFVGLIVAGLAIYLLWFNMNAGRYDDTAIPYLNKVLPEIGRWKFSVLAPMLSPQARTEFETEKGREVYRQFTRLGELVSIGKPQYTGEQSDITEGLGKVDIVTYTIPVEFETGPAVVKILLASNGEAYFIHHLGVSSEIFSKQQE